MTPRRQPIERTPPSDFRPPFCPRQDCPDHHIDRPRQYRFVRNGFYRRRCDRRRIQRYLCRRCDQGFSQQTFSVTYCMKRPDLLLPVAHWIASGCPLRRIARSLSGLSPDRPCHPSTIPRVSRRIGSQCLLVLEQLRHHVPPIREPIVSDHFEAFVGMQENALAIATPVGARSWFVYALEPAWHRQSTTSSKRRPRVARSPRAVERSVDRMLDTLVPLVAPETGLDLVSDDDPNHARAIRRHPARHRIRHRAYRNPPDRRRGEPRDAATRQRDAELFPVDLLHALHRNWLSDHRRETVAFGRRGEAVMERLALLAVFRNLVQRVSERKNDRTTPAMRLGATDRPWLWADVLSERRFPTRIGLVPSARKVLTRTMRDPRGMHWPAHVRRRSL